MFRTLKDFDFKGKKVLVRCDFDVPFDENGNILDDYRLLQTIPTIEYLLKENAKVILMGHAGRPDGKVVEFLRLDPVKRFFEKRFWFEVLKANDCVGQEAESIASSLVAGKIMMLENLRFHKEETDNDDNFAKQLSLLCDIYINNAFANSHRNHASMSGICKFIPSGAGLNLVQEITALDKIMKNPKKPLVVLIGGKKVEETKLKLIEKFLQISETIIISGLIRRGILDQKIKFTDDSKIFYPLGSLDALDINEESLNIFSSKIMEAKTILWNGPFGKFEDENCKKGTLGIANAIVKSGAFSVVGGGDTVDFIRNENLVNKFSHVSTGGGAMLAYLSGEELPGIKALEAK